MLIVFLWPLLLRSGSQRCSSLTQRRWGEGVTPWTRSQISPGPISASHLIILHFMLRCHVFLPEIYKKTKKQEHSNSTLVWSILGRSTRTFIWVAEGVRTSWPDSTTTRAPRRRATFSSHSLSSTVSSARTLPRVAFFFFSFFLFAVRDPTLCCVMDAGEFRHATALFGSYGKDKQL